MESKESEAHHLSSDTLSTELVPDDEILSSLPRDKGIIHPYCYKYEGFWHPHIGLRALIDFQKHFRPHKNDILLVTAPKSGTTWLKAIVYAVVNRQAHQPQNPHHPLLTKTLHQLVPFLEFLKPSEYETISNSSDISTRIFGCHFPTASLPKSVTEEDGCKMVYLCRDIKDNFVSLFHFANKANFQPSPISLEEAFDLFSKGVSEVGPIWDHILGYWKESLEKPSKVLFMRYEELKNEPRDQLRQLARFLGKPFSLEEENLGLVDEIISLCSFENMSKLEVNKTGNLVYDLRNNSFFRSGVVGDGKKYLPVEMAAKLDLITEEKFRGSGLSPFI